MELLRYLVQEWDVHAHEFILGANFLEIQVEDIYFFIGLLR